MIDTPGRNLAAPSAPVMPLRKRDADYVFYELTRSICPECRRVIDAQILLRHNKVYMRKRCPEHGTFEALVYGDAEAYTSAAKFNKPGTIPLKFTTEIVNGCPHDCGLCPDHQQHACLGIIEVNSACNMACPLCFADAGAGFNLTLEEVEGILDHLVATEGSPEVVQFSGGEPSIHPQIIPMMRAAKARNIPLSYPAHRLWRSCVRWRSLLMKANASRARWRRRFCVGRAWDGILLAVGYGVRSWRDTPEAGGRERATADDPQRREALAAAQSAADTSPISVANTRPPPAVSTRPAGALCGARARSPARSRKP